MMERAPSAPTRRRALNVSPSANVTSIEFGACSKPVTAVSRRSMSSVLALATRASTKSRFSTMCANGSPSSTSPPKVRKVGRTTSSTLESVTTMSRIGCASSATASQTPIASNSRRAAAAIAEARGSLDFSCLSAGIGHRHREACAQRLSQRNRQRQAGKAGPADHHVALFRSCRHYEAHLSTVRRLKSRPFFSSAVSGRHRIPQTRIPWPPRQPTKAGATLTCPAPAASLRATHHRKPATPCPPPSRIS